MSSLAQAQQLMLPPPPDAGRHQAHAAHPPTHHTRQHRHQSLQQQQQQCQQEVTARVTSPVKPAWVRRVVELAREKEVGLNIKLYMVFGIIYHLSFILRCMFYSYYLYEMGKYVVLYIAFLMCY